MKARANVVGVDIKASVKQAWQVLIERGYSKLLVMIKQSIILLESFLRVIFFQGPGHFLKFARNCFCP